MGDVPIELREVTEADWPATLHVVTAALGPGADGRPRSPEWWQWKHVDNPFGESAVLGAYVESRLVGVRAFLRWDLNVDGTVWRCARAVDTATHPDFQGHGIFRKLTMAGLELLEADGVVQVFNTPNAKSGAGYLKMGWQPVGDLFAAVRPIGARTMVRAAASVVGGFREKRPGAPDVALPRVADAGVTDEDLEWIANSAAGSATLRIRTAWTARALRWRYVQCPVADYRAVEHEGRIGAIVRINRRRGLREAVVSWIDPKIEQPGKLLAKALGDSVDYLVWRPGPSRAGVWNALKAGFVEVPKPVMRLVHRPVVMDEAQRALARDASNWHLAFGDLELL